MFFFLFLLFFLACPFIICHIDNSVVFRTLNKVSEKRMFVCGN